MSTNHVTIDLAAVTANYRAIARRARPSRIWAVVKGNAYGLGLDEIVPALIRGGAQRFVVANASEAVRLRDVAPAAAILALTAPVDSDEVDALLARRVDISVGDIESLRHVAARARTTVRGAAIHVEVDTGLGRGGFLPDEIATAAREVTEAGSLRVGGVWTHLVQAADQTRSRQQLNAFVDASSAFPESIERHIANSAGLALGRDFLLDAVRPGLALYGLQPGLDTRMSLAWNSRITSLHDRPCGTRIGYGGANLLTRETRIGVVPVGFADGYPRLQHGVTLVRGHLAPILGPVAMNTMVLDLTDVPEAAAGDEVSLLGGTGPSVETLLEQSLPAPVPNLFSCVRTAATSVSYINRSASLARVSELVS